jgi:heptosyltransferase I
LKSNDNTDKELPKVAVIRLSALGDVVLCASTVLHLAKSKKFKIYWITTSQSRQLLGEIEGVEFIIVPKPKNLKCFMECRRILSSYTFDYLLLAQASFSAHFVSMYVKAKRRIGFDQSRSKDFHGFFINERIEQREEHFVDAYYSFASMLGLQKPAVINWNGLFQSDRNHELLNFEFPGTDRIMAINPSASKTERNWEVNSYVKVIDHAHNKGIGVIVTGGSEQNELDFNEQICHRCKESPLNLTGKIKLGALPYLYKKIDFLLAPDTGSIHIACAVGTPVIGLYAVANPRLTGPYNANEFSINKFDLALEKFFSSRQVNFHSRVHNPSAMSLINEDEVIAKIELVLESLSFSESQ